MDPQPPRRKQMSSEDIAGLATAATELLGLLWGIINDIRTHHRAKANTEPTTTTKDGGAE